MVTKKPFFVILVHEPDNKADMILQLRAAERCIKETKKPGDTTISGFEGTERIFCVRRNKNSVRVYLQ